jgi:hypothetical protein
MIKTLVFSLALLLPTLASAEVEPIQNASPNGNAITPTTVAASTVTITGTGSKCFSVDDPTLVVDCNLNRVGIGDATPEATLEVSGTQADPILTKGGIFQLGATGYRHMQFGSYLTSPYNTYIQSHDANGASAQGLSINPLGGSVGIGTASPCSTCTLHVAGGASVTGNLSAHGNVGLGTEADASYPIKMKATTNVNLRITHDGAGNLRMGAGTDASTWDANMELRNAKTTFATGAVVFSASASPASGAACDAGTISWDASYIYVCTASGAWKRSALTGGY